MTDKSESAEPRDHFILKGGYYYRPNRCGYTTDPIAAGRYTKSEADREARVEPWIMRAVPVSEVLPTKGYPEDTNNPDDWAAFFARYMDNRVTNEVHNGIGLAALHVADAIREAKRAAFEAGFDAGQDGGVRNWAYEAWVSQQ